MRNRLVWLLCCLVALILTSCGREEAGEKKTTLAVIPKGTTHVFWQSVHAGAIKAAKELDVSIHWVGPEKEDNRQQQIALVDNQVINEMDGIVLAPLDAMALRRPVKAAVDKNIPVVIIDSGLKDSEEVYTSFVATDNREGGRIAGREMAAMLKEKGKVIVLRYVEGSASTENREEGFLEACGEFPDVEIVSDEQYGGATKAEAQQASENLLLRFKDDAGDLTVDGIFCPNASTTYGMMQALKRQRLGGKVTFVGFDTDGPLVEGLRQGDIQGLVSQDPFKMGYLGVKTMVDFLRGKTVDKRIDTGVAFITKEDLDKEEIKALISPDLDKWLNMK